MDLELDYQQLPKMTYFVDYGDNYCRRIPHVVFMDNFKTLEHGDQICPYVPDLNLRACFR